MELSFYHTGKISFALIYNKSGNAVCEYIVNHCTNRAKKRSVDVMQSVYCNIYVTYIKY